MKPCHPAIGCLGDAATAIETDLIAQSAPSRIVTPSDQLLAVGHRVAETLHSAGASPEVSRLAAATAVVAVLDELGGGRVHLPARRGFFLRLLVPALPSIVPHLRNALPAAEIARLLGVSRSTVERALRRASVRHGLPRTHQTGAASRP